MTRRSTTIINLWAGGGVGKSTQAAALFTMLKKVEKTRGIRVELVREFAKEYAWMGTPLSHAMQRHIYFEQLRREQQLVGLVDYIVTDSPTGLGCFYDLHYTQSDELIEWERLKRNDPNSGTHVDFLCPRVKPYNPEGRYETEEHARQIDLEQRTFLTNGIIPVKHLIELPSKEDFAEEIFQHIIDGKLNN